MYILKKKNSFGRKKMGKKNIKPSINQPVIRTRVAKPALEGLTEENLTATAPRPGDRLSQSIIDNCGDYSFDNCGDYRF